MLASRERRDTSIALTSTLHWFETEVLAQDGDCLAATHWTRLSCHRFRANEVRLLLGGIAYNLGTLLRRLVLPVAIQSWSLTSLQPRLFKTGGRLIRHARYFVLQLAESYLTESLFGGFSTASSGSRGIRSDREDSTGRE